MASTLREESCAMNRTAVSHQDSRPTGRKPAPRGAAAREAGLELIRRVNRWLIAAAVAAAGLFSLLAAHALHGHTVTTGRPSSSSSAVSLAASPSGVPQSAGGSGLQAPAQAPAPAPAAPSPVVSGGS
jgi:hypothetical protein